MIDLIEAGVVTNRRKRLNPGKTVYTFAMGQKAMYDFLDDNPSVESHPVDYVNDPHVIAQNDNVISVNAALQIELTGAVNAEHLLGHQYSATGGQLDFVRGAYGSRGGKSIIACHATAARGKASRIVARLDGPVTTPRIDTHIVMTEFGCVDLKGKSSTERAKALIALAHRTSGMGSPRQPRTWMVWAPVVGLAVVLSDLHVPRLLLHAFSLLGHASGGVSLFAAGIVLASGTVRASWPVMLLVVAKNVVQPVLVLGGLRWLGYGNPMVSEAVLTTAIPTMPIVAMLALQHRVAEALTVSALFFSVIVSVITLAVFIALTS